MVRRAIPLEIDGTGTQWSIELHAISGSEEPIIIGTHQCTVLGSTGFGVTNAFLSYGLVDWPRALAGSDHWQWHVQPVLVITLIGSTDPTRKQAQKVKLTFGDMGSLAAVLISLIQRLLSDCASDVRSSMLNSVALHPIDAHNQHQHTSATLL